MTLEEQFLESTEKAKLLSRKPTDETLLKLYALYKQATAGDIEGERPGGFDFRATAKYDAWHSVKGKEREECMMSYIDLVKSLE